MITKLKKIINKHAKSILKIQGVLIILLALILAGKIAYKTIPSFRQTIILATTVQPERFTELYFEKHLTLPKNITMYQTENFSFTIHNLEYNDMEYPYEVYIKCLQMGCNGEKQLIDEGKFTLKHDEYKTIDENYTITLPTARVQIIINLINKNNQQIHFWLGESKNQN
ncbi:hypothetical protein KKE68_01105 [Patescibacteria group bacterium]|nr:hypothetical protein [Patescibacteria group bacterium]